MDDRLEAALRRLVQGVSGKPGVAVGADDDLFATGVLSSFGMLEFLSAIEEEFACSVPMEELTPDSFRTLRAVAATLERLGVQDHARSR